MAGADATLYSIPGSHPAAAVQRMLELKGVPFKRRDLLPVVSRGVLRAMRFPGHTIPSLRLGDEKITGSLEISRRLDERHPEPPLFPAEPATRAKVEEAEAWGEQQLADPVRRIFWNAIRRDHSEMGTYAEGARLGVPIGLAVKTAAPIIAAEVRINSAQDERARADLEALPAALDRIDAWIEEGVLGGEPPNAADLQIAGSLRLAMTADDLRPFIESRPAGELAKRVIPDFPGHTPAALPSEWLEPLRASVSPAA